MTPKHFLGFFPAALCLVGALSLRAQGPQPPIGVLLPEPPAVRSPLVLRAVNDPLTGKAAFSFERREIPPVIHVSPGGKIRLEYVNQMSRDSKETCVDGPCRNMTNLHFHGLHVSPQFGQDDVISMMAMPGETLHYVVDIPHDQPPGLYWYHTHPHGESYQQSLDGMSGAIVIDGMERYVPEVGHMQQRILILRDAVLHHDDPRSADLRNAVQLFPAKCGAEPEEPERLFTVNGVVRPKIPIAPGERQFWRIVNASPDLYADLTIDSSTMTVIALDGMPLSFHDPARRSAQFRHVLVAPAGRVEAIVTGPSAGAHASLRSLCVNTGPDGDPNPEMVLADLTEGVALAPPPSAKHHAPGAPAPVFKPVPPAQLAAVEISQPRFVVNFTEDQHGFYINHHAYGPADPPMVTQKIGSYVHWRVQNNTREVHPFHIHQIHFLVYQENGRRLRQPEWLDTVNVEPEGSLDLVMDFTDPVIRGMSLFHCHLLKHEDKGMMAKILFQ